MDLDHVILATLYFRWIRRSVGGAAPRLAWEIGSICILQVFWAR